MSLQSTGWRRSSAGASRPLLILAAIGIARLAPTERSQLALAAISAGLLAYALLNGSPDRREDWRSVAQYLEARLAPSDCLLVTRSYVWNPLRYYLPSPPPCFAQVDAEKDIPMETPARVFWVFAHAGPEEENLQRLFLEAEWDSRRQDFPRVSVVFLSQKNDSPVAGNTQSM